MQRSADVRVLKLQLDLISGVLHSSRYYAPGWALVLALLGSNVFGYFGRTSFRETVLFPLAIAAATWVSEGIATIYDRHGDAHEKSERLQAWFPRFVAIQLALSAVWGLLPWMLWDPASAMNHVFVWGGVVFVIASFVISRANHLDMLIAGLVPLLAVAAVKFLLAGGTIETMLGLLVPVAGGMLFRHGQRLAGRVDEDSRLRYEVEDLAHELEGARDEALRKRFEAETANASKTAFLANMSHELRTPLNAILGFSEIIAKECFGAAGSPRYVEYAGDIHSSGSHLLSLINDLLDVAKIEAGRMELQRTVLEVRRTFETALKISAARARERKQELVIEVKPNTPPLYADERALKQILINLVSNAVKFTPEGGRIAVAASRAADGGFQIMVEDNGCGVPRDKLDKIFKPFSQVDNRYDRQGGGTGLGLALVRGLAELHGGRAWIESEHGHGCRAYVALPIPPAAARAMEARQAAA